MGFETIPGSDLSYGLISFDSSGKERTEESTLMSEALLNRTVSDSPTDIFFFCHGWKGDVPAAKDQYGKWIGYDGHSG